jgi:4-hydroxy-tetrahydrodipicolinate reductase
MVQVLIMGPNGKMGRAMVKSAERNPDVRVVGGVGPKGRDYTGMDLGPLVGLGRSIGARVYDDIRAIIDECDVVLDCTTPEASMQTLKACLERKKAFVVGTTGFSDEQRRELREAGQVIPVLPASNTSPIVHLLYHLIQIVTQKVGMSADIDIVEMHKNTKVDAPSGTAKEIGHIIAGELGSDLDEIAEYGRVGNSARSPHTVQFSSIRSGGIPSSHQVIFGFQNERLELTHHAYNMDAFADGMIAAALFISDKDSGCYDLEEAFGHS